MNKPIAAVLLAASLYAVSAMADEAPPPDENVDADVSLCLQNIALGKTEQDYQEAFRWCNRAAQLGAPKAEFALAAMYGNGHGVAKDEKAAVQWLRKSGEGGYDKAQLMLGRMYENGEVGAQKDFEAAARWYGKAAAQGMQEGKDHFAVLCGRMQMLRACPNALPLGVLPNVQEGFDRSKAIVLAAYNRQQKDNPAVARAKEIKLVVRVSIDAAGTITDCSVVSDSIGDATFEAEMLKAIRKVHFARWDGQAHVVEQYPIEFHPM